MEADGDLVVNAISWNIEKHVQFKTQKEKIPGISKNRIYEFTYNFD